MSCAQTLTARPAWYVEGNSKTTPLPTVFGKRSAQAATLPKASGIKAEWLQLGTRRGAQPASPTAVRRDALTMYA